MGRRTWINWRTPAVPTERTPDGTCKFCGAEIYWITWDFKSGTRNIPYHDRGHGGGGMKVLEVHNCRKK